MNKKNNEMDKKIGEMEKKMDKKMDEMDKKIGEMDKKIDKKMDELKDLFTNNLSKKYIV
jgi:hypothetical protein